MKAAVGSFPQVISSAANPLLKQVRRAVRQGSLTSDGFLVADSFHLVAEALAAGLACKAILAASSSRDKVTALLDRAGSTVPVRVVDESLLAGVAATETPQGVIALIQPPQWSLDDLFRPPALLTVLDALQDPGNVGAIVRATEAFGGSGVLLLDQTASPFNTKTLRASAGSLFRLPFLAGVDRDIAAREMRHRSVQLLAASSREGSPPDSFDWSRPTALIVGSEAHGVSAPLRAVASPVRIPTRGVESLNASLAAGVLLYEASRQRTARSSASLGGRSR